MALHEQCVGATDEWYTPSCVFDALGMEFDLDVASPGPEVVPWIPAARHITTDSLNEDWGDSFVWMNPPFGPRNGIVPWLEKFVKHGNGICLVPDRTSAPWWQKYAEQMEAVLFVAPKIKFIGSDGQPGKSPAQGTCLMSLGNLGMMGILKAQNAGLGIVTTPWKRYLIGKNFGNRE